VQFGHRGLIGVGVEVDHDPDRGESGVAVAEAEEGVVGFIAIEGSFVEHLYIAPSHQGIGIGETLLSRAKELRPEGLMLWTFDGNHRARGFYEKRGFIAVEFTDGSRNEERTPDVRYEWKPPSHR